MFRPCRRRLYPIQLKKIFCVVGLLTALATSGVNAQNQSYKFELSQQDLQVIAVALGKQPYETVARTMAELQRQISAQDKSKAEDSKEPAK